MANRTTAPITIEDFMARSLDVPVRDAAQRLIDVAEKNGASVELCDAGVSICYPCGPGWQDPISVVWLHPGERRWMTDCEFVFAAPVLGRGSELLPREVRRALQAWFDSFENEEFSDDASTVYLDAWAINHEAVIEHIEELAARLDRLLAELHAIHMEDLEDVKRADEVLERIRKGEEKTYSSEEVRAQLGLDD